jgi:hypothetical protein
MGKVKEDWWELIVLITMMTLIVIGLSSCKQVQYVPVEKIVTKDSVIIKKEIDSVYIKVKEVVGGDTVYRDSIVYHYVLRCDTIYQSHRDSIPYPVEVVKEVERSLNWYEKTMIRLGWGLIALVVAIVGWKVAKWYFKRSA